MSDLTSAQQKAVSARGNVLVVAGAGTGKTRTLVERCLSCLTDEKLPVSLDQILVVTFTEAAAAEIRQRIRSRLEQELNAHPNNLRWQEQLALFETAHIGTLHGFCFQLIRQYFHELHLDPQANVLSEQESRLLAEETLDRVLQNHYAGTDEISIAVQQLIQDYGRGSDKSVRALVFKLHHYSQTLPNPKTWFREQLACFNNPKPEQWEAWFLQAINEWREEWQERLAAKPELAGCLSDFQKIPGGLSKTTAAAVLEKISGIRSKEKGTRWPKALDGFFEDVAFLGSLVDFNGETNPLAEDWDWVRSKMATLLRVAEQFQEAFLSAKRQQCALDFHDLEQYALRLLSAGAINQPSQIARQWREKLRFVFVDEYQDINAAQDRIIVALSRDGADANRFLVGDIKQSIYRFRLANPYIFQSYANTWQGESGATVSLTENFRSRERLLDFVNSLFGFLMQGQIGPVVYDEKTQLRFGAPEERLPLATRADEMPRVELHLRLKRGGRSEATNGTSETTGALVELQESEKEARLAALRLRKLKDERHQIWDEEAGGFRVVEWSDMAVLLRSPSNKAESYAKAFCHVGVPLVVERGSFYQSIEISDALNLLKLIDNPLQDLPLLAVLRSPLVGLNVNELSAIRAHALQVNFWTALRQWHRQHMSAGKSATPELMSDGTTADGALAKVNAFLNRYARWRRLARLVSLSKCVETVLQETYYSEWLLTQPRGEQRAANVRRLIGLIREYDQFHRQGLFRFLRFVDAQIDSELDPEVPTTSEANAVRLMSIHQSKGLEFPVVVVADLGKPFNFSDLYADVILDEAYGLCPQVKPPRAGKSYPGLTYWMARKRQKKEMLGEELRLLYVATTRARDTLILTASISEKKFESLWKGTNVSDTSLLSARSYADWIGAWFSKNGLSQDTLAAAAEPLLRWRVTEDEPPLLEQGTSHDKMPAAIHLGGTKLENLRRRLGWKYAFSEATVTAAKASVSALRRQAGEQLDTEVQELLPREFRPASTFKRQGISASAVGNAHHKYLQFVSLDHADEIQHLRAEAERLAREEILSADECAVLDFSALVTFWKSDLGFKIRAHSKCVRRELAFTARFSSKELAELAGEHSSSSSEQDFVVVQGVADLIVQLPELIWLVDFKTDQVEERNLEKKSRTYALQLKLYSQALARIYRRPVTERYLHFLRIGKTISLGSVGSASV